MSLFFLDEFTPDPILIAAGPGSLLLEGGEATLSLQNALEGLTGLLELRGYPAGLILRSVGDHTGVGALLLEGQPQTWRLRASIPEWPDTLPALPMRQGFEEEFSDTTVNGDLKIGPGPIRRRTSARQRTAGVRLDLEIAQKKILMDFFTGPCQSGAKRFQWVDWADGETPRLFRFVPPLTFVPLGDVWEARVTIEMLPT
jgi:hypothetical protein